MLRADVILISDTTMISLDTPSITSGLRGLSYIQVELSGLTGTFIPAFTEELL